jgi:hypothetical protein
VKTIYKYPLRNYLGPQKIMLPACAIFRHFQEQDGVLTAWFEVSTNASEVERTYQILGTGRMIPENALWQGTCQQGPYMWHLYWLHEG